MQLLTEPTTAPLASLRESERQQAAAQEARRQELLAVYRRILARHDSPHPGDARELKDACAVLAISSFDVEQDLYTLQQAAQIEGRIITEAQKAEAIAARDRKISELGKLHRRNIAKILELVPDAMMLQVFASIRPFLAVSAERRSEYLAVDTPDYDQKHSAEQYGAVAACDGRINASDGAKTELAALRRNNPRLYDAE